MGSYQNLDTFSMYIYMLEKRILCVYWYVIVHVVFKRKKEPFKILVDYHSNVLMDRLNINFL